MPPALCCRSGAICESPLSDVSDDGSQNDAETGFCKAIGSPLHLPVAFLGRQRVALCKVAGGMSGSCGSWSPVRAVGRAEMPVTTQQSVEFISACPQTAQPVVREIEP
jgi:hypothetical protein